MVLTFLLCSLTCVPTLRTHSSAHLTRARHRGQRLAVRDEAEVRAENDEFHRLELLRSESFHSVVVNGWEADFQASSVVTVDARTSPGRVPSRASSAPATDHWEAFRFSGLAAEGIDASPPAPFGVADLAHVSRAPLFSVAECAAVIAEAEADPAWRGAQPLAAYATNASTFRPLGELPRSRQWLIGQLEATIFPAVLEAFPACTELSPAFLRVSAASVVKYNASAGQTSLGVHRDGPELAATIPLNGLDEYDGGGTYIEALERSSALGAPGGVLRRPAGHLILHPASVRHGGATITRGLRYILVVWLYSSARVPHGHHSAQRAARLLAAALRISPSAGSSYRRELLAASVDGFDEALLLGAADATESAHVGRAQALLELGDTAGVAHAQAALLEALRLAPRNAHAAALLSRCRVVT
jgi:hypothetical protein